MITARTFTTVSLLHKTDLRIICRVVILHLLKHNASSSVDACWKPGLMAQFGDQAMHGAFVCMMGLSDEFC